MYNQGLIDIQTGTSNRQSNLEKEVNELKKKIEEIEKRLKIAESIRKKHLMNTIKK